MINKERLNKINIFLSEVAEMHKFVGVSYTELITLLAYKPLQPIQEAEKFFLHLMEAINSEDENSFNKNLEEAKIRIEFMSLDILKILWIEINKNVVLLLEKDKITPEDYHIFKDLAIEARNSEVRDLDSERIKVLNLYKKTIDFGKKKINDCIIIKNIK